MSYQSFKLQTYPVPLQNFGSVSAGVTRIADFKGVEPINVEHWEIICLYEPNSNKFENGGDAILSSVNCTKIIQLNHHSTKSTLS